MSVIRLIVLHPYTKFEVRRPSRSEDMAEFRSRPGDLDLSTYKWGHGSAVSWASLLPIFSLPLSSVILLTNKQTSMKTRNLVGGRRNELHTRVGHGLGLSMGWVGLDGDLTA